MRNLVIIANLHINIIIVLAILTIGVLRGFAETSAKPDQRELVALSTLSSDKLISEGLKCVEADTLNDRAIALFTIVANRYYENQTDTAVRRAASEALHHLGTLYMTHDIDYRKAYKSLYLARQIAEEDGNDYRLAYIYNNLAHLYHYNANADNSLYDTANDFIKKAVDAAVKGRNEEILPSILVNIAIMTINENSWGEFEQSVNKIKTYGRKMTPPFNKDYQWVKYVTNGVDAMYGGNYKMAEDNLLKAKLITNEERYGERKFYSVNILLTYLYRKTEEYEKAIDIAMENLSRARNGHHTDYELSNYATLTNIYEIMGNQDSVDYYYNQYLKLQAEFEENEGYHDVQTLDFRSEIESINNELEQLSIARQREKRQHLVILFALILVSVICLTVLLVYMNLRKTHRNLFRQNEEMTRRENEYRRMREQWNSEKEQLLGQLSAMKSERDAESDDKPVGRPAQNEHSQQSVKASSDDNGEYERLYTRILNVMATSPDIYKAKYTLNDLATTLGVTTRAVSRAINLSHHSNFNTLLNDYRLREVSRLMHEPGAETLTIEGLAEKAGFSSRTYFATVFKKATGLTPSEYLKMTKLSKP